MAERRILRWGLVAVPLVVGLLVAGLATGAKSSKRPSDEVRGRELYDRHCVQCHGANAKGDGPAAEALVVPVPDLHGVLEAKDREEHVRTILDGSGAMPGFEASFDRYDARKVMRHMEKQARIDDKPAPEAPAVPAEDTDGRFEPGGADEE